MTEQCTYENCTREAGHEGPHGLEAMPGIVIAPRGDGSIPETATTETMIRCNSCGAQMELHRYFGGPGGEFKCTNTACRQYIIVLRDGRVSSTVATLWGPTEPGKPDWLEFVRHKCNEWHYDLDLKQEIGIKVAQKDRDEIELVRQRGVDDHQKALPKPLLERIRSWIGSTK